MIDGREAISSRNNRGDDPGEISTSERIRGQGGPDPPVARFVRLSRARRRPLPCDPASSFLCPDRVAGLDVYRTVLERSMLGCA